MDAREAVQTAKAHIATLYADEDVGISAWRKSHSTIHRTRGR